jgi:hypothetical protein
MHERMVADLAAVLEALVDGIAEMKPNENA